VGLKAKQVIKVIVDEVKLAKYFSFSVDSTPDISNTDQLTFTVRYVKSDGQLVERFLKFVQISSHTGLHLFDRHTLVFICPIVTHWSSSVRWSHTGLHLSDTIVETFRDLKIDINDCRGQT